MVKYLKGSSGEPLSRFCSNIRNLRQTCFNLARFRSRSSSIFATQTFSLRIFFFFSFYLFLVSQHFISYRLHNRCTLLRFSLLFSPKHSVFCRQIQLIPHYVMVTVALPGDRTQCTVRSRTTSTVVSRQRSCVVVSVLCVVGLPTAANYFPVSDEL